MINKIRASNKIENMGLHSLFHILKKCKQDVIQLNSETNITNITITTPIQETILDILDCSYLTSSEYLLKSKIITS